MPCMSRATASSVLRSSGISTTFAASTTTMIGEAALSGQPADTTPDQGGVDVRAGLGHPPDAFDARDEGCPRSPVALVDVQIVDACGIDSYRDLARTGCGHVDVAEMEILGSTVLFDYYCSHGDVLLRLRR